MLEIMWYVSVQTNPPIVTRLQVKAELGVRKTPIASKTQKANKKQGE